MRKRLALYIGIAAGIVSLWLLMVFIPLERERQRTLQHIPEVEAQLTDIDRTLKELPAFLERSNSLEAFKTRLNSSLYAKADILKLFRQIGDQAAARGLTIAEITPPVSELLLLNEKAQNSGEPCFLNITLYVHGDYVNFGKFVSELEGAPFFRGINSCHISSSRDLSREITFAVAFKALLGNVEKTS